MSWDPYLDLESGVLQNRLGITDRAELAHAESALTAARLIDLDLDPLPGAYDLAHLRAFHRVIFGDVYHWAGELRTVSIGKGQLFCLPQHLESFAADVFGRLAADGYLHGMARAEFLDRLTALLADVNALHPFREGNGRTQRAFLTQLARDARYRIEWPALDPARNVDASRASLAGDNAPLRALLEHLVCEPAPSPADASGPPQPRRAQD